MITKASSRDFLDSWTFSAKDWNLFTKEATSLKKEDNIYMAIATILIGIPILMISRNTTFLISLLFVVPFAILIPWIRYVLAVKYLKLASNTSIIEFYSEYGYGKALPV